MTMTNSAAVPEKTVKLPTSVTHRGVGIQTEPSRGFSRDTEQLLQSRLRVLVSVIVIQAIAGFIINLFKSDAGLVGLRITILLISASSLFVLWKCKQLKMLQLRGIELLVIGLVVIQLGAMYAIRLGYYAQPGETASLGIVHGMYQAFFAVLICMYGMFIPNHWRGTLLITSLIAITPAVILTVANQMNEAIQTATASVAFGLPISVPFFAIIAAVFATYNIHQIRKEVFDAKQLNQYRLQNKLGAGGMGEVYLAEHQLLQRPCALKLIRAERNTDQETLKKFEREVRATAKLTHFNTVEVYDYGFTDAGVFYYVMELLPGMDLGRLVATYGRLSQARTIHILNQCCDALAEAHSKNLIHRDLKPGNIYLTERGGVYDVVKVIDYGLVRDEAADREEHGDVSGSPLYMCPEQVTLFGAVDGRGDIYALGCVAYFMLTGHPPFSGRSVTEVLQQHASTAPEPMSKDYPEVPKKLDAVVLKCLSKKPSDRFSTTTELKHALNACQTTGHWSEEDAQNWWAENGEQA